MTEFTMEIDLYALLMRHAVSPWHLSDFDRPLIEGADQSIHKVADQIKAYSMQAQSSFNLSHIHMLCVSPARRTQETYNILAQYWHAQGQMLPIHIDQNEDLYLANAHTWVNRLYNLALIPHPSFSDHASNSNTLTPQTPDTPQRSDTPQTPYVACMIGHNPGISHCITSLTNQRIGLREAEAVLLHVCLSDWSQLEITPWSVLAHFKP